MQPEILLFRTRDMTGSEGWWDLLPQGQFGAHCTPHWRPLRPTGVLHAELMAAGLAREFSLSLLAFAREDMLHPGGQGVNKGPQGADGGSFTLDRKLVDGACHP